MEARLDVATASRLVVGDGDYWTRAVPELGIRSVELADGPHGLRRETGTPMVWEPATAFPTGSALGATWDPELVAEVAGAIGAEARAHGVAVVLGPGVTMKRTPRCGRNFEYLSEDPFHAGVLGAAYVTGMQREGVGACLKHFAVNNQETERTRISVEVEERALRETYLAAFEHVVTRARPWLVMAAYNRLGGVPVCEHRELLTQVLRQEWGFEGVVVSDWDAVRDPVRSVRAGLDLVMPGGDGRAARDLASAVASGALDREQLDAAAGRVVALSRRGVPATRPAWADGGAPEPLPGPLGRLSPEVAERHHAFARRAATAAMTLLRNDGTLPLDPAGAGAGAGTGRVAVVGAFARHPRIQGGGSSGVQPTRVTPPLDLLRERLGDRVAYAEGYRYVPLNFFQDVEGEFQGTPAGEGAGGAAGGAGGGAAGAAGVGTARAGGVGTLVPGAEIDHALIDDAVRCARDADVTIAFVGLPLSGEVEAQDRESLDLPRQQVALLDALGEVCAEEGRPFVVVLMAGSAVTMGSWHERCNALLLTWLPGQAGPEALVDVLLGDAEPGGRLAESFPLDLGDVPGQATFPGERGRVVYGEGVFIGYRWYDALARDVRYPFGHGLSYTSFAVHDAVVDVVDADAGRVAVSVAVTNVGVRAGSEVVQLYVGDPVATVRRPPRELRGFRKVWLEAGQSATLRWELTERDFAWWDSVAHAWRREAGELTIELGTSSRAIHAAATIVLPASAHLPELVPDDELELREPSRFTAGHRA